MDFSKFVIPARPSNFVEKQTGETKTIQMQKNDLLYFRSCKSCTYEVTGKVAKVIIESCEDCHINISATFMTGTLEVIHSKKLEVTLATVVPTLHIENTQDTKIEVPRDWMLHKLKGGLFSCNCSDLSIVVDTKSTQMGKVPHQVVCPPATTSGSAPTQFISRFINGKLTTEEIVREGLGYATTQREKDLADQKEAENKKKMDELMGLALKLNVGKKSTPNPTLEVTPQPTGETSTASEPEPEVKEAKRGVLGEISGFNKSKLNPTTTVETTTTQVIGTAPSGKSYGHTSEEAIKEYFDEPSVVEQKVKELATLIKEAKHLVLYTGAGVSTSAKIPDYRGPKGVWTLQDKGIQPKFEVTLEQALPTPSHMAIVELGNQGIMKYLVSTNVDGLHRRAGTPADKIAELHGNCYKEICPKCEKEYLRRFDVACGRRDHKTGRSCEDCKTPLIDSIINFGESLPEQEVHLTQIHSKKSDFSLVLGTSMTVSPACNYPIEALKNKGKMVIVNLQKTPFDHYAHLIIRAKTDDVMQLLMKELGLTIPSYAIEQDQFKGGN